MNKHALHWLLRYGINGQKCAIVTKFQLEIGVIVKVEWIKGCYIVSDDCQKVDLDKICELLVDTYWVKSRPRHAIEESIKNSIVFGMYTDVKMVGFARVTTDMAVFGWVSDVIIDPEYRGQGLGTWLMECVFDHPVISKLGRLGLATKDAHGLYEKFGFQRREVMMLRRN